jgi:hypothetical protein
MRKTILKLAAAFAVVTASAAPALACGGGLFTSGGCAPCGQAYETPCAQGYNTGYGYAGVGTYQRLPDPVHQYYYVNQGPTFSGPGQFAPYPTYQETAVSGPGGYYRPNYGYYDGGPYGNATNHYSYAQPAYRSPAIYSYGPRVRPGYRHGYGVRARHYGFGPRYGYQHRHFAGPRMMYAPRFAGGYRHAAHGYAGFHHSQRRAY